MNQFNARDYASIIYPYHGMDNNEERIINTHIQAFANSTSITASLHTGGRISTKKALKEIKAEYKKLKRMKKFLKTGSM